MYNEEGESVWERSLDSFGRIKEISKGSNSSCPFMYAGQYFDKEINLAYNRFRYYCPEDGRYISRDPIGLNSGEYGLYNYVGDPNGWVDVFGLAGYKAPRVKAFDTAGIDYTEHFAVRVAGRRARGITGRKALDTYNNGRLYYNPATKNYIRHNSRTKISVVVNKKVNGKAITVFEGNASRDWVPIKNQK